MILIPTRTYSFDKIYYYQPNNEANDDGNDDSESEADDEEKINLYIDPEVQILTTE